MPQIEGLRIRNYKALRDVTLGRLWDSRQVESLSPLTAVIGKNGVGKSTLFDAFGFLSDCLNLGVEAACDAHDRGGFGRLQSQGVHEPISFDIYYREEPTSRPITYHVSFNLDKDDRPYVESERLRQRRYKQSNGQPYSFLWLDAGRGRVWRGMGVREPDDARVDELMRDEQPDSDWIELDDNRRLGIATLGQLTQHPRISSFRQFIEGWYLSYFTPDAARALPMAGPQRHLNMHGDNIGNVVQYMERERPAEFRRVLDDIAAKIPGIGQISTERTLDGRLVVKFNETGFRDPFLAQQMSDGTLKVFAYLLLMSDPSPMPFLCIEEPENGLYHKLLETLADEFRERANRSGSQVFITTHQPYLVNALSPDEVWLLERGADGFSTVRRASDDPIIVALVKEGLPLGGLWYSDYLEED